VQLAVVALALSLAVGIPAAPSSTTSSSLPATWPGMTRNEGVFLVTPADDGSQAIYFIAQNTRHSVMPIDLQVEQQLNPLRPLRFVDRDEVLAYVEAAPIGGARAGLLGMTVAAAPDDESTATDEAAPGVAETLAQSEDATYVLRPGDNLTRISEKYGTTVGALLAANGLPNANRIHSGQTIVIPGSSAPSSSLAQAESPAEPAPQTAVEQEAVADAPDDAAATTIYTVKPGDSAILIARRFGVDYKELLSVNGVANPNRVYAGQTLTIPGA
jgi:LysM repeat protein